MKRDREREPWVSEETIVCTLCWATGVVTGAFGALAAVGLGWL